MLKVTNVKYFVYTQGKIVGKFYTNVLNALKLKIEYDYTTNLFKI